MGGKTRVFGKNRVFSTKPGFPGRTSVLLANPGYFKGLEAQGIYPSNIYLLQVNCFKIASQSITVNHPMGRKPSPLGLRIQDDREKDDVVENTLEILGSEFGGGKCMENVVFNLCVGCTCCLVVSQVKSSGLLLVLCCFYAVSSSFFHMFAAGTPIIAI